MRAREQAPEIKGTPTFKSYLADLSSSTSCCRSASLLVPTVNNDANAVLRKLREWKWLCESVLVRPWRIRTSDNEDICQGYRKRYLRCLPTEEELVSLRRKFTSSDHSTPRSSSSLREGLMHYHLVAKSIIVPLTSDATAFLIQVLFDMPARVPESHSPQLKSKQCSSEVQYPSPLKRLSVALPDQEQNQNATIQTWFSANGVAIVHNCDGNQTVSLSKEVDLFPKSLLPRSAVRNHTTQSHFTFADLFAGIGGFRIGLEALGGICIGSCEIDPYARDTYRRNFFEDTKQSRTCEFFVNDITRLDIPPNTVDILCGGFPCQSFSTLASFPSKPVQSPLINRQGGLNTPQKGKLFYHLLRVLRRSQPKVFIFENVKGLVHLDNGNHFEEILRLLEESGYHVIYGIVDSAWFLPQRRERIYFVGIRLDLIGGENSGRLNNPHFEETIRSSYQIYGNGITNADSMDKFDRILMDDGGLRGKGISASQSLSPSRLGDIMESRDMVLNQQSHCFLTSNQWEKVRTQSYLQIHSDGSGQLLTEANACAQTLVSSYRSSFLMHSQFVVPSDSLYLVDQTERLEKEARKKKRMEDAGMNIKDRSRDVDDRTLPRFFTPRECCRLQGFPESFTLPFSGGNPKERHVVSQFYRQIGNAVSPPCVAAVAEYALSFCSSIPNSGDGNIGTRYSPVFDLILEASPNKRKVLAAIESKVQSRLHV